MPTPANSPTHSSASTFHTMTEPSTTDLAKMIADLSKNMAVMQQ
jgi:hypothetical protein